jgi:transcriptional regulator with XRE-family HTH domain
MPTEERRESGRYLAGLRDRSGLTQHEAAERIGISRVQLARWEAGTSRPEWERLDSIADAFLVDVKEIRARCGYLKEEDRLSPWAVSLAHRIERRALHLKAPQRKALEKTIDSLLTFTETA